MAVEHVAGAAGGQILTDSRDEGTCLSLSVLLKGADLNIYICAWIKKQKGVQTGEQTATGNIRQNDSGEARSAAGTDHVPARKLSGFLMFAVHYALLLPTRPQTEGANICSCAGLPTPSVSRAFHRVSMIGGAAGVHCVSNRSDGGCGGERA